MTTNIDVTEIDSAARAWTTDPRGGAKVDFEGLAYPLVIIFDGQHTKVYRNGKKLLVKSISYHDEVDGMPTLEIKEYLK